MPLFITPYPAEPILECYGLELAAGGGTGTVTANTVYLCLVRVLGVTVVTAMRTHCGATAAAANDLDMGIYSLDGTSLLGHTGQIQGTASTTISPALIANATLQTGFYWIAFADSTGTNTYSRAGTLAVPGTVSSIRIATNTYSSGLPSTTGTILAPASAIPLYSAVTSGGIP